MFEKVNPMHPDKIADRIAGAIVDYAYSLDDNPIIQVEALLGHGEAFIIIETNQKLEEEKIKEIVKRISKQDLKVNLKIVEQDKHLADNQSDKIRCGDNGIFLGLPITEEEDNLSDLAFCLYRHMPYDGKYLIDSPNKKMIICQSNDDKNLLNTEYTQFFFSYRIDYDIIINPLGPWTGGLDVDSGAVNRKLGSDLGRSVTGGGIHGKDLSKADVTLTITAFIMAQILQKKVEISCKIGDEKVRALVDESYFVEFPYEVAVRFVKHFLTDFNDGDFSGAFENLASWGLQLHYHWNRLEDFEKVICETNVSKKNILKTKISRLFHV